jgi:transposase
MDTGRSLAAIAAELGLSRNTVRRFARAADPGELLIRDWAPLNPGILPDYEPYLQERWNCGCTNATQLWQEIRARGYPGGYSTAGTASHVSAETPPRPPPLRNHPSPAPPRHGS